MFGEPQLLSTAQHERSQGKADAFEHIHPLRPRGIPQELPGCRTGLTDNMATND